MAAICPSSTAKAGGGGIPVDPLNAVIVEGNVVPSASARAPEAAVCAFCIQTQRRVQGEGRVHTEVSYFEVEAWDALARVCAQQVRPGVGLRVVGRLKQDRWQQEDGVRVQRVKIVAEHVEFQTPFVW
ncbi:single-stranded DNA-binding protein [Treponema pallidum subsp. pallidum]|uniref:Single-stranded DNA-binding protein n=3 Tax=Treponema pallidum TaxID=160 RepID=A0A0H3BIK2_TREPS|nr:hypothetical protein TPASS_0310 [Treponema pallidum subsp. pallidum SS14]AEZ57428.1 putative single-stranded DNA-binding protein [Treponema pallidum subsp. pertenue str. SamoaD]AEZ58497.1 putative single-stranded DNA-binding protein [Treponema pallidum subsp. pertenue str. CDC2]AEZ59565.1 putative single-stranded DNA-binding protein [Treponema pallidum subsp. pertenue str. Gauthier]AFU66324.1 putative single-stranded DNA-binding protein [Treponema pallidum subsp. pallidum str. Mexico A]AGK8